RSPAKVRVLGEDAVVYVLEREQKTPGGVADSRFVESARGPYLARGRKKESNRIGAVTGDHRVWIDDVAEALRHLLPFGVQHQIVDDDGAIRRGVAGAGPMRLVSEQVVRQGVTQSRRDRQQ